MDHAVKKAEEGLEAAQQICKSPSRPANEGTQPAQDEDHEAQEKACSKREAEGHEETRDKEEGGEGYEEGLEGLVEPQRQSPTGLSEAPIFNFPSHFALLVGGPLSGLYRHPELELALLAEEGL
ncbi:hypothetical protein EBH_0056080 [Eimeria brunetti]|uniref:Uncharacterized protein n=1 Tax=Eimeria brunetti TaxID=51314 RepID=U6LSK5_9EIME|nr:hypothetical protein EBH_0056080 [Eimeria brunetti]